MSRTVTDITPLAKDPNYRRVRVDGRIIATLRASDVQALSIDVGSRWTAALARRVEALLAVDRARIRALRLLGRRSLSRGELHDRLHNNGINPAIIPRVLDELERNGWLNDAAYAESLAHEWTRRKPASRRLIAAKLQARQINPDLAEQIAHSATADADPIDAALALAQQRLVAMRNLTPAAKARRIAGQLARRGYDEQIIETVLDRLDLL